MAAITLPRPLVVVASAAVLSGGAFMACEQQHVFRSPEVRGCRTVQIPKTVEPPRAADILFVIDNSGSMAEEQENLARNSSSIGGSGQCNTATAVRDLKQFMDTTARGVPVGEWPAQFGAEGTSNKAIFDDCGFIERLQLFDNDFRIGIISTDNEPDLDGFGTLADGGTLCGPGTVLDRPRRPQRGCLQPEEGATSRVISSRDGDLGEIARRFREAIVQVDTCGAAVEEGLGSIKSFFSPDVEPADPRCANDLDAFLRKAECLRGDAGACLVDGQGNEILGPEPKLVVIVLSDEEDCTHNTNPDAGPVIQRTNAAQCYSRPDALLPTSEFVGFLRGLKSDPSLVSVAAIVGGYRVGGDFVPGNCRCNDTAADAPPLQSTECSPVLGNSIIVANCGPAEATNFCGNLPNTAAAGPLPDGGVRIPCCTADLSNRYVDFARGMDTFVLDSICAQNYKDTMIEVANLINIADQVALGEAPADPRLLQVEVQNPNGSYKVITPHYPRDSAEYAACNGCTGNDCRGWALTNNCKTVKFYGADVPVAGSEIRVSFLGASETGTRCTSGAQ